MLNGNGLIKRGPWCRDHDRDQIVAWRHDHRSFKCSHEHSPNCCRCQAVTLLISYYVYRVLIYFFWYHWYRVCVKQYCVWLSILYSYWVAETRSVIQSDSWHRFGIKEEWMEFMNAFVSEEFSNMRRFLQSISVSCLPCNIILFKFFN